MWCQKRCNHSQSRSHSPSLTVTTIQPSPSSPHNHHHTQSNFKLTETHTIEFQTHRNLHKSNSNSLTLTQFQNLDFREEERVTNLKMASLQKFKFLAMQCGASQSPTRSPRKSPLVHPRRRKTTLQMLLRRSSRRRESPTHQRERLLGSSEKKSGNLARRNSLKDLFGSSPPGKEVEEDDKVQSVANAGIVGGSFSGPGSPRPGMGFRYRSLLSRKAWRPVLFSIDE